MKIFGSILPYNVNQRQIQCRNGDIHWRVCYSGDAQLAIDRVRLFDFAYQLGLTHAEVSAILRTEAFPPLLTAPNSMHRANFDPKWLREPAVAALLALAAAKHKGHAD